ncbi:MAG: Sugar phosphate isomerase/epimerase [Chloroflexi bacterium]|nr:Sugar phosphate isomerase/epimerase [Chloroflexota bacterium]
MSNGSERLARVLLKARPTLTQLSDRFAPPWPQGLELYLDKVDVATEEACDEIAERIHSYDLPADFPIVVEGPIRSLDNEYVDLSACTPASRELVHRLGRVAVAIGAEAVNMHAIMPRFTLTDDDWTHRQKHFDACMEFIEFYVDALGSMGVTPIIENVPPVLRMRESAYLYTPLGMAPEDVAWFVERAPGLMVTLDVSHAQLYVNARGMAERGEGDPEVEPLMRYLRHLPTIESVETFIDVLGPSIFEAHISNASGLLGEGARYGEGDIDMERVISRLARIARYLITETLEPDNDRAVYMREAQLGMTAVIERLQGGSLHHPDPLPDGEGASQR